MLKTPEPYLVKYFLNYLALITAVHPERVYYGELLIFQYWLGPESSDSICVGKLNFNETP